MSTRRLAVSLVAAVAAASAVPLLVGTNASSAPAPAQCPSTPSYDYTIPTPVGPPATVSGLDSEGGPAVGMAALGADKKLYYVESDISGDPLLVSALACLGGQATDAPAVALGSQGQRAFFVRAANGIDLPALRHHQLLLDRRVHPGEQRGHHQRPGRAADPGRPVAPLRPGHQRGALPRLPADLEPELVALREPRRPDHRLAGGDRGRLAHARRGHHGGRLDLHHPRHQLRVGPVDQDRQPGHRQPPDPGEDQDAAEPGAEPVHRPDHDVRGRP